MIIKAPVFDFETDFVFPESIELAEFDDPTFKKVEVEYLYWDKIKYLKFRDIDSEAAWQIIKSKRAMAKKALELRGHSTNINFYHTSNNSLNQPLHYLDFNFGAGIQKEQLLSDLDKQHYLKNALMEESIFSSMIEGATTTRIKAKEMLRKKRSLETNQNR